MNSKEKRLWLIDGGYFFNACRSVARDYQFDYLKSVTAAGKSNPVHTHFKLRGVFKGDPVPAIRATLQEDAPEPE